MQIRMQEVFFQEHPQDQHLWGSDSNSCRERGKLDCIGIPGGALKLSWPWEAEMTLSKAALSSLVGISP